MKKLLVLAVLISSGAMAGPQYVTMQNGRVCEVVLYGNAGHYGWENFLGMDYETCRFPGIEHIKSLNEATPPKLPKCDDGLVAGGAPTKQVYPCYIVKTGK